MAHFTGVASSPGELAVKIIIKKMRSINIQNKWLIILFVLMLLQGCTTCKGPASEHFDGSCFFNPEPGNAFFAHIKWLWEMEPVEWPEWIEDPIQTAPAALVSDGELHITFINHATMLIQMDGMNILTDPIWSDKAGPLSWLGAKRVRAPGVKLSDLPDIHIILISHDHYDHLDRPTLKQILDRHNPVILCGLGVESRLDDIKKANIVSMDWFQEYAHANGRKIRFVPARHNSGRTFWDGNKTLWGGFVIESPSGHVLFMGDTAFGSCFSQIKKQYSNFRAAVLPIGSYEKRWFMKTSHMNPDDAVKAHLMLNVQTSIGSHFGTFNEHPELRVDAHEKDLEITLKDHKVSPSEFLILNFGQRVQL